jgi:DNA-binding transcriptional LysR family regulator
MSLYPLVHLRFGAHALRVCTCDQRVSHHGRVRGRMIEFRQLRYLIAAAEAGSFSRAAQRLGIKQATLSRHILETEKRLGLVLFDRKTRGASLAVDGQTYLRKARHIVKELDELNEWVRSTRAGESGSVAIGFYTSFSAGNLRATLSAFSARYLDVKVRVFERDRDLLLAGLENQSLDIAIIAGKTTYPGLATRPFWSERLLAALPKDHPLAARDRIYWSDLTGERFLLTKRDPGPRERQTVGSRIIADRLRCAAAHRARPGAAG